MTSEQYLLNDPVIQKSIKKFSSIFVKRIIPRHKFYGTQNGITKENYPPNKLENSTHFSRRD